MTEYDKTEAKEMLKKLYGRPPYNGPSNFCWNDGYYAKSIEDRFRMPLRDIEEAVNWK